MILIKILHCPQAHERTNLYIKGYHQYFWTFQNLIKGRNNRNEKLDRNSIVKHWKIFNFSKVNNTGWPDVFTDLVAYISNPSLVSSNHLMFPRQFI